MQEMICPLCNKAPGLNQFYGIYRGNLFIVKMFKCCWKEWYLGEYNKVTKFVYNAKTEDYEITYNPIYEPLKKFNHMRLLVGNLGLHHTGYQ